MSIGIGLYAARRVHNTADYAGGWAQPAAVHRWWRTTFATWFGSETVLGVSARVRAKSGLGGVVEDPFGAGMCLILVGLFFAYKLHKKNLITIGDYYRLRYGRAVEVLCSIIIIFSYLGWVAAQVSALGLVFNLLTGGALSIVAGMVLGTVIVLDLHPVRRHVVGGRDRSGADDRDLPSACSAIAWFAGNLAGGAEQGDRRMP